MNGFAATAVGLECTFHKIRLNLVLKGLQR
jgi:hypothetical protein